MSKQFNSELKYFENVPMIWNIKELKLSVNSSKILTREKRWKHMQNNNLILTINFNTNRFSLIAEKWMKIYD